MDPKLIKYFNENDISYEVELGDTIIISCVSIYFENNRYWINSPDPNEHRDIDMPDFFSQNSLTVDELIQELKDYEYPFDLPPYSVTMLFDMIVKLREEKIKLREENEQLKTERNYQPGNSGYDKSKSEYTHLINS